MDRSLAVTDGLDWSTFFSLPNYYSYFGSSFIAVQFGSFSALPCLKGVTVRPGRPSDRVSDEPHGERACMISRETAKSNEQEAIASEETKQHSVNHDESGSCSTCSISCCYTFSFTWRAMGWGATSGGNSQHILCVGRLSFVYSSRKRIIKPNIYRNHC